MNNIKANDYLNVVIHALLHVTPLRNTLLLSSYTGKQPELLKRFAALAKKVWNSRLFKAQVSPHEFLQEVTRVSAGRFKITQQGDPVDFLGWLLNILHRDAGGTKRRNSSIIYSTFQGELRLDTQQVIVKDELSGHIGNARPEFDIDRGKRMFGLSTTTVPPYGSKAEAPIANSRHSLSHRHFLIYRNQKRSITISISFDRSPPTSTFPRCG